MNQWNSCIVNKSTYRQTGYNLTHKYRLTITNRTPISPEGINNKEKSNQASIRPTDSNKKDSIDNHKFKWITMRPYQRFPSNRNTRLESELKSDIIIIMSYTSHKCQTQTETRVS